MDLDSLMQNPNYVPLFYIKNEYALPYQAQNPTEIAVAEQAAEFLPTKGNVAGKSSSGIQNPMIITLDGNNQCSLPEHETFFNAN